ncbi:DUF808 domain-containing protein [Sphingorhabdus arenilitoris]|uniref:DUF808 domain-containing protein n=1 Tax=Sphingorhabdus arenilitoris TaxID=1490041 RepID=A0ABV8RG29_9SPHN
MPSGLFALLDDVATITKMAAASIDDIGAAAAKAGTKAAGVVVDDTAVTPRYLVGFHPSRELPIIWRIAKGSLKNKLLFILPVALLLSAFLPWLITPILMIGGTYLCYEGAEKLLHAIKPHDESLDEKATELTSEEHEEQMASGAIRTDFILSAEIMAIALGEVANQSIYMQAVALIVVALAITVAVYGVVAVIVKMDDIGLNLAKRKYSLVAKFGRGLVLAMPKILGALSVIGTAAMLWVGGQIVMHGIEEFGFKTVPHALHDLAHNIGGAIPFVGGLAEWTVNAAGAGVFGVILGGIVVAIHQLFTRKSAH